MAASYTLTTSRFPNATVVYANPAVPIASAPAPASATMSGGSCTFEGLLELTDYVAHARVAGVYLEEKFRTGGGTGGGGAETAADLPYTPTGTIAATDTQTAVAEVAMEAATALSGHISDSSGAHAASAISVSPTGSISSTNVQAALAEIAAEGGGEGAGWRDYLRLDEFGITYYDNPYGSPDQSAIFQDAIDAAGTGSYPNSILIAGKFNCGGTEIIMPNDRIVPLVGTGAGTNVSGSSACILWEDDDGDPREFFGIKGPHDVPLYLRDFTMVGPCATTHVYGRFPANRYGLYVDGAVVVAGMRITEFGAAVGAIGDHHLFRECDFTGNGFAVDYMHNPDGGLGDERYIGCQLTAQTMASFGIDDTNTIANVAMANNGHCGYAPYGVYRYPSPVGDAVTVTSVTDDEIIVTGTVRTPAVGQRVSGTGVPYGSYIASVSGASNPFTLTLAHVNDEFPDDAIVAATIHRTPRSTALAGLICGNWSWEGIGNSVMFDEPNYVYNAPASFAGVTHDNPADVSSFGAQEVTWAQVVDCTGTASDTVTGVELEDWIPFPGDYIGTPNEASTPIPLDTEIVSVSGEPGNYTIVMSAAATGTFSTVRIGKPRRGIAYDVGLALGFHWREGGPPIIANQQPERRTPYLVRARAIDAMHSSAIQLNPWDSGNDDSRIFDIHNPYNLTLVNEHADLLNGVVLGANNRGSGILSCSARICSEAVLRGQVLQIHSYATVEPYDGTGLVVGVAAHACDALEVVVYITEGASSQVKVLNTSGSTIAQGKLLKPHSDGGVAAAANPADGPIIGKNHDSAILDDALGLARLQI